MDRKKVLLVGLICFFSIGIVSAQVSFGQSTLFNSGWRFSLSDPPGAAQPGFDASGWRLLDLPHDWSVEGRLSPTLASCTGYLPGGIGWYRKDFVAPESKAGKKLYLYFEGVYNRSEVFLNGHSLGKRPNGYVSFLYELTPYLKYGESNTIAVRVDHSRSADSRWYTGSGIYRHVYLVASHPVHIAQWGVYAYPKSVSPKQAVLQVEVETENGLEEPVAVTISNELLSPSGKTVARSARKASLKGKERIKQSVELKINHPRVWSLASPERYVLKTFVTREGEIIDQASTRVGLRQFSFDPDKGFSLNGEPVKMKGVCLHHDAGVLGAAVPREVWRKRLLTLKELGCNAVRTSHNPQAPDLYDLCDELGVLVLNEAYDEWEFPKRKWLEGWNVGTPGFEGSYDFFAEWGERDLADMVRRDRNHASVFAWSIGNEVDYPNDPYSHPILDGDGGFTQSTYGGYKKDAPDANRLGDIAQRLVKVVKQYDPSRPVTAGLAGVAMSNETEYPGALDIVGYNYTESRYDSDHKKYPNRIIYGSENRHDMSAWKAVRDREFIFGQFLWTGIDYLGESGRWPSRGFYSGLLDVGGQIKPRGFFRQSLWSDRPMAYLGTYPISGRGSKSRAHDLWSPLEAEASSNDVERPPSMDAWPVWNYREGQTIRAVCYTNASQAQLFLNGEAVGDVKPYDDNTGILYWDIPYKPGKLEVVGMDASGNETARYAIQTSGRPFAIRASLDQTRWSAQKGLACIEIQLVDENGIPVMLSDDELTCDIVGPANLLGMEAGNNTDMSRYTDNRHRVFHGRMRVYIQSTGEEGEVNVRFSAPWLRAAEIAFYTKTH